METLGLNELMKLNDLITRINTSNDNLQVFVRFEEKYLLDISVRLAVPEGVDITTDKMRWIYDRIIDLSRWRLIPERDELLRYGILEIKVSYTKPECDENDFIRPLEFIAYDMVPFIMSGD